MLKFSTLKVVPMPKLDLVCGFVLLRGQNGTYLVLSVSDRKNKIKIKEKHEFVATKSIIFVRTQKKILNIFTKYII